jgi:hypothetical protein
VYRHGVGTAAVTVGFVTWALSWALGVGLVADAMDVECRDSPCFVSAPERTQHIAMALALVPAVVPGVLVILLWRRHAGRKGDPA